MHPVNRFVVPTVAKLVRHPIEVISLVLLLTSLCYISLVSTSAQSAAMDMSASINLVWRPATSVLAHSKSAEFEVAIKSAKIDGNVPANVAARLASELAAISVQDGLGTVHTYKDLCVAEQGACLMDGRDLVFAFNVETPRRLALSREWTVKAMQTDAQLRYDDTVYHVQGKTEASAASAFREAWNQSSNADVLIVAVGYILMHATFVSLFQNLRKIGSKFTLGFAVLMSSTMAMLVSLVVGRLLGVRISIIQLSEAIPFFVVAIGFSKPYRLSRSIVNAGKHDAKTIRDKVIAGVEDAAPGILRDYAMEIAAIGLGAVSGVPTMADFCKLACLILTFDALFLFSLYLSLLTLKLELLRMRESTVQEAEAKSTLLQGKSVDGGISSLFARRESKSSFSENVWMHRAKLFVVLAFVAIHAMNASTSLSMEVGVDKDITNAALETIKANASHTTYLRLEPTMLFTATATTPSVLDSARSFWKDASPRDIVLINALILAISVLLGVHASATRASESRRRTSLRSPPSTPRRAVEKHTDKHADQAKEEPIKEAAKDAVKEIRGIVKEKVIVDPVDVSDSDSLGSPHAEARPLDECMSVLKANGPASVTDAELVQLVESGKVAGYALEKTLGDLTRVL